MRAIFIYIMSVLFFSTTSWAAERDTTRKVLYRYAGGPGYSPERGVVLANTVVGSFRFRGAGNPLSIVPLSLILYIDEKVGYKVVINPQLFLKGGDIQILGALQYTNNIYDNYFGVGYNINKYISQGEETTQYLNRNFLLNGVINHRIADSDWFIGGMLSVNYSKITEPSMGVINDPYYQKNGGTKGGQRIYNNGLGINISYDTRDVISNPYLGRVIDINTTLYAKIFGGDNAFGNTQINYREYRPLSQKLGRKTLAWMVSSNFAYGDIPFTQLPTVGSAYDLRGYYLGQYRDKATTVAIIEYRHKFSVMNHNWITRVINSLGYVAWVGAGLIGHSLTDVEALLPNFGAGLRVRLQDRLNFRFDMGYNPLNRDMQVYFGVYEAF